MRPLPFTQTDLEREGDPTGLPDFHVVVGGDGALIAGRALVRRPGPTEVLLGIENGHALYGLWGEEEGMVSLREAGLALAPAEAGLAAYASSLLHWHAHHAFCPFCGARTEITQRGAARRCSGCGRQHFPHTDPVVIMAVSDGDRLLLGRRPTSPAGRYSVLAGFVAPGETAEQAVVREVWEEARIRVDEVRYVASQPWPFPGSLMLGFLARADGDPQIGDEELADVRWFERAEVACAAAGEGRLQLPGEVSIARRLIHYWLALPCPERPYNR